MSNTKSLLIVEGEKAEYRFFQHMGKMFGLDFVIFPLKDNLYVLYKKLKDDDFNVNVKSILLEMFPEKKEILDETYAFTYLIFDLDPHHTENNEKREYGEIIESNIEHALEMTEFFQDETDPTIGKIYINYPMFESFRYCNSIFDEDYKEEYIGISDIRYFKELAGKKKMVRKHIENYLKEDFLSLSKMNIYKLSRLFSGNWESLDYLLYQKYSGASGILRIQKEQIDSLGRIAVLNTSLFMLVDYYGNRDGFYEKYFT